MPVSKRNKIVSLTKTGSKGRSLKAKCIEEIREFVDEYKRIYVFSFSNMRTTKFREIRMDWKESKIYMGKNTVAQIALGRSPEEEYKDNLRHVTNLLEGNVAVLFTNRTHKEVSSYFEDYNSLEFAKAGAVPEETITIDPCELPFPVSMLDELRKLGMIVEVEDGKVVLRQSIDIATSGVPLTPEQARLLVKFERPIIRFSIKILCKWENGKFKEL